MTSFDIPINEAIKESDIEAWFRKSDANEIETGDSKYSLLFCHASLRITINDQAHYIEYVYGDSENNRKFLDSSKTHFEKYESFVHKPQYSLKEDTDTLPGTRSTLQNISLAWCLGAAEFSNFRSSNDDTSLVDETKRKNEYFEMVAESFPHLKARQMQGFAFSKQLLQAETEIQTASARSTGFAIAIYFVMNEETETKIDVDTVSERAVVTLSDAILRSVRDDSLLVTAQMERNKRLSDGFNELRAPYIDMVNAIDVVNDFLSKAKSSIAGPGYYLWDREYAHATPIYGLFNPTHISGVEAALWMRFFHNDLIPAHHYDEIRTRENYPFDLHYLIILLLYIGQSVAKIEERHKDRKLTLDCVQNEFGFYPLVSQVVSMLRSGDQDSRERVHELIKANCFDIAVAISTRNTDEWNYALLLPLVASFFHINNELWSSGVSAPNIPESLRPYFGKHLNYLACVFADYARRGCQFNKILVSDDRSSATYEFVSEDTMWSILSPEQQRLLPLDPVVAKKYIFQEDEGDCLAPFVTEYRLDQKRFSITFSWGAEL